MKEILSLLACLLFCPLSAAQALDADDYPLRIEQGKSPHGAIRFSAVNDGAATVSVSFRLAGENLQPDREIPPAHIVAPHSRLEIVRVAPRKRLGRFRFRYEHSAIAGDVLMSPDQDYPYRLPFRKGVRARIGQAPGGSPITHTAPHNRHAVDFGVPQGTLVTAARAGTVIEVKDGFTEGRPDPALGDRANRVVVIHSDRSVGYYLHLAPQRIRVRPGQEVRAGDALAHSGNTGYSSGPHLHFDVRRAVIGPDGAATHQSVPINFRDAAGRRIALEQGGWIEAD